MTTVKESKEELLVQMSGLIIELRALGSGYNEQSHKTAMRRIADKTYDIREDLTRGIQLVEHSIEHGGHVSGLDLVRITGCSASDLGYVTPIRCGVLVPDNNPGRVNKTYGLSSDDVGPRYIETARRLDDLVGRFHSLVGV